MNCSKCNRQLFQVHSEKICEYFTFVNQMKEQNKTSLTNHHHLDDLLNLSISHTVFRLPIDDVTIGYIEYIYFPVWVERAVNIYDQFQYDMPLGEFLKSFEPA